MDGIRITGQNLFSEESIENAKNKVHSLVHSKGMDIDAGPQGHQTQPAPAGGPQNTIRASSTLNSIEVRFQPYQGGTKIEVDHGISTLGLVLGILGLILFLVGIIVFLLWFLKYNETKDDLNRTFPGYLPPEQPQYGGNQPGPTQQNVPPQGPTGEDSGQITPEDETQDIPPEPKEDGDDRSTLDE